MKHSLRWPFVLFVVISVLGVSWWILNKGTAPHPAKSSAVAEIARAQAEPAASTRNAEPTTAPTSDTNRASKLASAKPQPAISPLPADVAEKLNEELREKPRYDQPGEAIEYYRLKRLPAGETEIPMEKYLAAKAQMDAMPQYSTAHNRFLPSRKEMKANRTEATPEALGTWEPLGPGNIGGRTRALLIHPTTPNIMYAAGVAGGVWKTTNAGAQWQPLTDLMANIAVSCLAFDPGNPKVIYAGTGEGFFNGDAVRGAGIFRTTDGGANWTQLPNTGTSDFYYVNDLVVSKANPQHLYAGTRSGVWRSLDTGATWSKVLNYTDGCLDLVIRTDQTTDYVFAACGTFGGAEIFRNTDAGGAGAWTSVQKETGMGRTSLALAPSNQNIIYALSANTLSGTFRDGLYAVFRSTSSGDAGTWTAQVRNNNPLKLNTVLLTNPLGAFRSECGLGANSFSNQGWYDNVIAVDPLDENNVWVGGIDLFRSDDGGLNWGLASYWWAEPTVPQYAHADQHTIVFHPHYNGTSNQQMFVGNDGGIFRTDNARASVVTGISAPCNPSASGVRWTALNNNYGVTQFYHGAVFPDGKSYFGGTQDNGTLLGTDANGVNGWREIYGGDGGYVAIDPTNPNVLYASLPFGTLFKSTDGGATFGQAMAGNQSSLFISPFAMDPSEPKRLWAGVGAAWRSLNAGAYWEFAGSFSGRVTAIAIAPTDANYALIGTSTGSINRNERALSWNAYNTWFSTAPRSGFVSSVAFDPTNKNICYATYSTFGEKHIYRSTDGGFHYTSIDGNLPDVPVHCIIIDPSNSARLFIGTDLGVFVSTDNGNTWAVENTGFANTPVESLTLQSVNGATSLYAFTHGRGVWKVAVTGAGNSCSFSFGATGQIWSSAGGTGNIIVNNATGCAWNASSNTHWIVLTGGNGGSGNGTVGYYIAPNTTTEKRVGTITIADKSYVVQQDPVIDRTPPRIQVTTPTSSGTFMMTNPIISIAGTLADNAGVTRMTWTTDRGMSGDGSVPSPTTWAIQPNLPLANGEHNFTFTAWDAAGNSASTSLKVIVRLEHYIVTIIGGGNPPYPSIGDGGPAINARLFDPRKLHFDKVGNLYITDLSDNRVRKVDTNGIITTFAGGGTPASGQGDGGPATAALLASPLSITGDDNGNIYISGGYRIRQVDASGIIRTIAGMGERAIDGASNEIIGDGVPAVNARLQEQPDMGVDSNANLYIADNYRVRKITPATGIITTVAGTGQNAYSGDGGPARNAALRGPSDLAIDPAGNIYTAEMAWIRKVDTNGIINRIAGIGNFAQPQDGAKAIDSGLSPNALALDKSGVLYFTSFSQIWKIRTDGIVKHVAGGGSPYGGVPSVLNGFGPTTVKLDYLRDVTTDAAGRVYFLAYGAVHKIAALGDDTTKPTIAITAPTTNSTFTATTNSINLIGVAADDVSVVQVSWKNDRGGSGVASGTGDWRINNLPIRVGLNKITVTAWDAAGNAQTTTLAVTYNPAQLLTTFAGKPLLANFLHLESGTQMTLPETVAVDSAGNLYIAERGSHRIRKVTRGGLISTVAGNGQLGSSGDGGLAINASMNQPNGVAVDNVGNVYVADTNNHRIRKVNPAGIITTIAGTGIAGFAGDGGVATQATLNTPVGITVDNAGNLLIADAGNHRIRKLEVNSGLITTIAGNGYGAGGDAGQATQAQLNFPTSVAEDKQGNLYISDTGNHQVRKVSAAGVITRFAGAGTAGFSGDGGAATAARFTAPGGLTVDVAGNVYITDQGNNRVRKVTPDGMIITVAGNGTATAQTSDEGSAAINASLNAPAGVAVDGIGNLFIADTNNHRVVVVAPYQNANTVNAASYTDRQPVSTESIVSAFGANLATREQGATQLPLPTELAGTMVKVRDSLGVERLAPLFYVGKLQVNYQIPPGTAAGYATVTITNGQGEIFTSAVNVTRVTPGIFAANQNGRGAAAAAILYITGGSRQVEQNGVCDANGQNCVARPIDLSAAEEVYVELYGTGIRNNSGLSNVTVGGVSVPVLYAGQQPDFVGLDQVNIRLPRSLAGRGEVDVVVTVDGQAANPVRINIK